MSARQLGDSGSTDPASGGTYTFLFTDVEGSTRRWETNPEEMAAVLAAHDRTLSVAVDTHRGTVFKNTGDGICAVFTSATEGVLAAIDAQRQLMLPVRMAVHTGKAIARERDFFGVTLSRCARLVEVAHGGQVLVSAGSSPMADALEPEVGLLDLGEHRLRDLSEPERVFQVLAPGLRREFPNLRSLDAVRHNLPVLRSSFVGRQIQLTEVCELLLAGRFVTLTGIGGCGKTRLALEAAARVVERFAQGVFFVDLAVLSDPDLLGQTVASALGIQLLDTSVEGLAGYLAARRVLVVLDNCEHLVDACAELVDGLLARCPELSVLATSREALGLDGEQAVQVPSLNLETEAVRLFMDRARAARPDLRLDTAGDQAVAEICQRLDGIPLAIELAAARTTHLAPAQILERLSDRFGLLTGGRRRVQRQQTLTAAIDWSFDLLTEAEQTLLRRLAVFRGSFSLQAVEEVCHPDALDMVASLVAKSLVGIEEDDAAIRYRLLETVRLYAEERLVAAGEAVMLRSAHRDWLLSWLESFPVGELLRMGAGAQLVPDADNLNAALDWSLEQDRGDLVVRMASRMLGYWWSYLRVAEMAAWWRELETRLPRLAPDLRATALLVGMDRAMAVGAFEKMEQLSAAALAIAPEDSWVAAYAWSRQALYWTYADPERGRRCIEQGRTSAVASSVPEFDQMIALWSVNLLTGDPERDEELGAPELIDGLVAMVTDDSAVNMYGFLGMVAALGDTDRAARLASGLSARTPLERFSQEFLAVVIASREARSEAMAKHLQALVTIVREYAIPLGDASCLIGFAAHAVNDGDYETASRHLASVRSAAPFPFRTPLEVLVYRQLAGAVGSALNRETAQRCRAEGATTSVTEALNAELARLRPITQIGTASTDQARTP